MTIRLHRGDLPDLSRYTDSVAIDTETMGLQSASRPALRGAIVERRRHRRRRADPARAPRRAQSEGAAGRPEGHQDLPFRPVRSRGALQRLRRDAAAGLLHQDRLAALPHLHRSPRPEGSGARGARRRPVEAAAVERLGRGGAERSAIGICGVRRAASACACANGSMRCWRARAAPSWRKPVSNSCRRGRGSICKAGRPRTFSRIRKRRSRRVPAVAPLRSYS